MFIGACGTVISFKIEGIEFVRYRCLLIDFGEKATSYVVPMIPWELDDAQISFIIF